MQTVLSPVYTGDDTHSHAAQTTHTSHILAEEDTELEQGQDITNTDCALILQHVYGIHGKELVPGVKQAAGILDFFKQDSQVSAVIKSK